jgi:hypothetical protein
MASLCEGKFKMTAFLLGLMIGIVIGRAFDLWVDWKYKK